MGVGGAYKGGWSIWGWVEHVGVGGGSPLKKPCKILQGLA